MKTAAAVLSAALLAGALAGRARAGGTVSDEIIMKSERPGREGVRIFGRVLWIRNGKIRVLVNDGQAEGPVTWSRDRVKNIEWDLDGRRAELPAANPLALYKFALWELSLGYKKEACFDLESAVNKDGVPAEAFFTLAKLQEELGDLRKALESYRAFVTAKPADKGKLAEARAAIKRLEPKVAALPRVKPIDNKDDKDNKDNKDNKVAQKPAKPPVEEGLEIYPGGWRTVPWADPATITLMKDEETGNQFLAVQMSGKGRGANPKTALTLRVGRTKRAEVKSAKLIFHVYNPTKGRKSRLPISVAFQTGPKMTFHESRTSWLAHGWQTVTVDLNGRDFKCEATEWAYTSPIKNKNDLKGIIILINTRRKMTVYIDYIKFTD